MSDRKPQSVGDVFQRFGESYRSTHKLPIDHVKVMRALERCRTAALGGHVEQCPECGYQRVRFNSCRNRHCPTCQSGARERWLYNRKQEVLPVAYYHVVFTVPSQLNALMLRNEGESNE